MRVISGKYKSRTVKAPKSQAIRPTSDKVKGALFNMLEPVEGCSALDLFAGTGNLGIEALSRGASQVVFVDQGREALGLLRENLKSLGIPERSEAVEIMACEAAQAFYLLHQAGRKFDILMADPPYGNGALKRLQQLLKEFPILAKGGIFAVEHDAKDAELAADFSHPMVRQKKYGDTMLTLFRQED